MHKALQDAQRSDLVQRNVADLDMAPRKAETERDVFTAGQARTFLDAIRGDRLEALFVQVRSSHREMKGRFIVNLPKTARGRRKIALNATSCQEAIVGKGAQ
jgi:hypothetical protein